MIGAGLLRRVVVVTTVLGATLLARPAAAKDPLCRSGPPIEPTESTDALLGAAEALTTSLDRPRARALYLAVLARDPGDEEAAVGLARVDAVDGCFALAMSGYRDVLSRSPGNVDARAGLADILIWTGRWKEAGRVLDEGLAHAPLSPELLARRARLSYFSGDPTTARRYIAEAQRVSPLDPEVREARERMALGQMRLGQRVQLFPSGYDDILTTDASAMIRWRRLRFELDEQVVNRHGAERPSRSGPVHTGIIDGRPTFGTYYHFENGAWAGGSIGVGAPAVSLPHYMFSLSGFMPLGRVLSGHVTAAYWRYKDDRDVAILSPALGVAVTESVDLLVRYWLTAVSAASGSGDKSITVVHSVGARIGYRVRPRLSVGLDYTYGVQLERNPTADELVNLRSHIVSLIGVMLFSESFGIDGALSLERRESKGPAVFGPAAEVGAFVRW
jgi:YaiO family outer membrane protein